MPIEDPLKRRVAARVLLFHKVCRDCGARNAMSATRCRKCRSDNLRPKRRKPAKRI